MTRVIAWIIKIFVFGTIALYGQSETDTFRIRVNKIGQDSARANALVLQGRNILYSDPAKAWEYCQEAIELSKKAKYTYGLAGSYRLASSYHADILGDTKKAESYLSQSLKLFKSETSYRFKEGLGAVMHSYGAIYQRNGDYSRAVEYYVLASKILDSIGNKVILPRTYNNLSTLYAYLKLYDKSEYYARAGLKVAMANNDMHLISVNSVSLSASLINLGKYKEVLKYNRIADSISAIRNDIYIQLMASYNYSTYYGFYKKDYNQSVRYGKKAYELSEKLQNSYELSRTALNLAEQYEFYSDLNKAKEYAVIGLQHATNIQAKDFLQRAYSILGMIYLKTGEYRLSSEFLSKSSTLKDSVFTEASQFQINFLEAQYQKQKNESEIEQLTKDKQISTLLLKRRNILVYTLAFIVLLLGVLAWIVTRSINQKKALTEKELEIQKQKIIEMEKQRQLEATLSVLRGEEAERSRLARDLHDGLGGLLSGVKLNLTNMKGNVVLSETSLQQFDKTLGLLDSSIRELRRVAHNMMPEALVKFGMKDALSDFCHTLENSQFISVKFQHFGNDERIESKIEISVYRIAQELINNAIKHSRATEILVQLIQEESRVHLTVQDNGKGFDTEAVKTGKGAGLINIQSRAESQNGRFEIFSQPDKGTEASVEFPLS